MRVGIGPGPVPAVTLRGLTWDHPRATGPLFGSLKAFHSLRPDVSINWDVQPLSGFEFHPVHELAERYDLLVFDHPHVGEIACKKSLLPLGELLAHPDPETFVGSSLASYRYAGQLWGMPIDAACQVAVYRADLLARVGGQIPHNWSQVLALAERARAEKLSLAIAFSGVHALMTLFSLCANHGYPLADELGVPCIDEGVLNIALDNMLRLLDYCPRAVLDWNSIELQNAMSSRDDLVYCPAVYGFCTYAMDGAKRRLNYADLPGVVSDSCAGSTLGGAGIGISAGTVAVDAACSYLQFLSQRDTQVELFPAYLGQPAHVAAWHSRTANERYQGFFEHTRATLEQAWVRPRFDGYLKVQLEGGMLVEGHLRGELTRAKLLDQLRKIWRDAG